MCYLIEKRMNKTGCIALQTEPGEEMAKFADRIQERRFVVRAMIPASVVFPTPEGP